MSNTPAVQGSQEIAIPVPSSLPEGLEDTDLANDLTMPIFRLDHENLCIVNSLTNEQMPSMDVILLGRIKQRILWPMDPSDGKEQPMCRSYDFNQGVPRAATWVQPQKNNPALTAVKLSGFDYTTVESAENDGVGLACANCALKDWGADRTPPWCNEQWTFPFVQIDAEGDPLPGVISFAKTGLKPCKTYVSGFVQAKSTLYTVVTRIKAVPQSKGSVSWVVPSFQRINESDATQWPVYSQLLHQIRGFLTTPRVFTSEDPDEQAVQAATAQTATVTHTPVQVREPDPEPAAAQKTPVVEDPPHHTATTEVTGQTPVPAQRAQPSNFDPDEEPF